MGGSRHAIHATGAFGGAPYGAAILVKGVPKWGSTRNAGPRGHGHWGLRWNSLWGHDPREGCAEIVRGRHANPATGAFSGAPYGATISVRDAPKLARGRHADPATGAFGGAPYGDTKRVRGVPKWGGPAMRAAPLGP